MCWVSVPWLFQAVLMLSLCLRFPGWTHTEVSLWQHDACSLSRVHHILRKLSTTVLKVSDALRTWPCEGEDTIITTKERDIELVPRLNKTVCLIFENEDEDVMSGSGAQIFVDGSTPVSTLALVLQLIRFA